MSIDIWHMWASLLGVSLPASYLGFGHTSNLHNRLIHSSSVALYPVRVRAYPGNTGGETGIQPGRNVNRSLHTMCTYTHLHTFTPVQHVGRCWRTLRKPTQNTTHIKFYYIVYLDCGIWLTLEWSITDGCCCFFVRDSRETPPIITILLLLARLC